MPESQIAVLIDFENVGLDSVQSLFDQLSDVGRIIIKRAYADWSKTTDKVRQQMLELGIEPKSYFRWPGSAKNSSDIMLAIDAIDVMYRSPVDTFVVVSSDTDFVPLVGALRAAGKTVIGAGRRAVVSKALIQSCDRYISLDEGRPTEVDHTALRRIAESLLDRAMGTSTDDLGHVVAAKLHNTMLRMDPSFDFRALGHRNFTQFLAASPRVNIRRPGGRGDVLVEPAVSQNQHVIHRGGVVPSEPAVSQNQHVLQPERGVPSEPAVSQNQQGIQQLEVVESDSWASQIDAAWSKISGDSISGSKAASEAAKVLGVSKVSASRFKNLQGILDASEQLKSRWSRQGNTILKIVIPN